MPAATSEPLVIDRHDIDPSDVESVLDSAAIARADVSVIQLQGPGAVTCVQGVTTADLESSGDGAFLYGATLTPKGMIIADLWLTRLDDTVTLYVPSHGYDDVMDVLRRSVPPRLAKITDLTHDSAVFRVVGPLAAEVSEKAGFEIPEAGTGHICRMGASDYVVARPTDPAPFGIQITGLRVDIHDVNLSLSEVGATPAKSSILEVARVIAGWPRLGAEIDAKTLPQEVRFDELNGVSYTKGCYTGQEIVARLHFRGHANRRLIGISWDTDPDNDDSTIFQGEQEVGRITSIIWLDPIDQFIGLGVIKSKTDVSESVVAGGADAHLVELPFQFES